jgi:DNA-binding response OmpR family regulator
MSTTATAPALQKCVLLIEDSEQVMLFILFALQEYGQGKYRLEWATHLSAGVNEIRNGAVDAVLLDLGLPESSARVSYAWVRAISPNLPILVLTGESDEYTELATLAGHVDGYSVNDLGSGLKLFDAIQAAISRKQNKNKW